MKEFIILISICGLMIFGAIISHCNYQPPIKEIIYVPVEDSIAIGENIYLRELLRHTQDSLNATKDSLGEDLFITKYKLNRIKYYNDIAAKGNNIKYLRGWINRVLNE